MVQEQHVQKEKSRFLEFRSVPHGTMRDGKLVLNRYSSLVTNGHEHPGAQAMLYAAGVKDKDQMQNAPHVGTGPRMFLIIPRVSPQLSAARSLKPLDSMFHVEMKKIWLTSENSYDRSLNRLVGRQSLVSTKRWGVKLCSNWIPLPGWRSCHDLTTDWYVRQMKQQHALFVYPFFLLYWISILPLFLKTMAGSLIDINWHALESRIWCLIGLTTNTKIHSARSRQDCKGRSRKEWNDWLAVQHHRSMYIPHKVLSR